MEIKVLEAILLVKLANGRFPYPESGDPEADMVIASTMLYLMYLAMPKVQGG